MADQYIVYNAAPPTTAGIVAVSTGTAIKTLLQLTAPSTKRLVIKRWGISFTGTPAAILTELIHTTTVAGGTPTAVTPTILTDGAAASLATAGFSPATEGSIVATTRPFDSQILSSNYTWEWALGTEPILPASGVLRVRVTAAAAVNALCWLAYEE